MTTTPRAVAATPPKTQQVEEKLQAFSINRLRQIFSSISPNRALLGGTELLKEERARDMLYKIKPTVWMCPSTGELFPAGYSQDTAQALTLLPATEIFTTIVQRSDERPAENILLLSDEFVVDTRNYSAIAESGFRRKSYAASKGKKYASNRQLAMEIGITESSFSRHVHNV